MSDNSCSASLSRAQGRNTWAVIFRLPKRTDPTTGKEGLRVRQSLKTDNEQEAAMLRDQRQPAPACAGTALQKLA